MLQKSDTSEEMKQACNSGMFYVHAIPCGNSFSIGCLDENLPCVFPVRAEAEFDISEMNEEFADQIALNERDKDDVWEGILLTAIWNGGDDMKLLDGDYEVANESWKRLAGL